MAVEVLERGLDAGSDLVRVIARTVLGQQELQHEGRHVRALLNLLNQVLADNTSGEHCVQFFV